jgi:hypothetical protein
MFFRQTASNYNTRQNVHKYNKTAQIEFTLLAMFILVSCFPLASINVSKQVNINRLASTLRRRRGIFFLNSEISYQNSIL